MAAPMGWAVDLVVGDPAWGLGSPLLQDGRQALPLYMATTWPSSVHRHSPTASSIMARPSMAECGDRRQAAPRPRNAGGSMAVAATPTRTTAMVKLAFARIRRR
ncbi:hypothetical protein DKT69_34740 [Micromonospora sicca]|uniref:Uncharacterized protein n=1 Tax=Micromonospora sicca TaxID=2202420 RepID=A0A317CZ36_9ACTN|nr:hypothetical protein DKT69_34740 [Micromonospora sp. 4G51]